MRKVALLRILVLLVLSVTISYGQKKVKYKDIFELLNTKQYEQAESFLKDYLKENDDNPNAFLFMGLIYQEKGQKDDVLKQTKLVISHMDSSIYWLSKAYKTITEKEVKRNDEYYQAYNRRDLRTGEFGVKLADIQFDLEKRMQSLREKIDRVKMVKHFFTLSDSLYRKSNTLYQKITSRFPGEREFFLRSDSATVANLSALIGRYDSAVKAFDQYKSSISTIGKIGYNQVLVKNEIKKFKSDGETHADFFQPEIQIWDYKTFATNARDAIVKDIFPIREHLITYDIEINKLREKLNADSVSVASDLTRLIDRLLMEQLKKYDSSPLPMDVFSVKIADLTYRSMLIENRGLRDSSDVHFRRNLFYKELKSASSLDSLATRLIHRDIDKDADNYAYFINNTYSNTTVLKSYIKVMKEFAEREKVEKTEALHAQEDAMQWMVLNADSIPLFVDTQTLRRAKFRPLIIVDERYTTGIKYADSLNAAGYFYSITPSRVPDIKINFPLEKGSFRSSQFKNAKGLTYSDAGGQIFFVLVFLEKAKDNKYPATLAKIYRSDGLAWSTSYNLTFVPKEIGFRSETGELVIKSDNLESIVDKNGKLLR
jgi:hypothetical protein